MIIAIYVVTLYITQGFSFGVYQIRIATALYALAYVYPFLVVPLGIANLISNFLFGGLGFLDMFGGCFVGMASAWLIVQIRQHGWNIWLIVLPIWAVPSLGVSVWLSYLLHIPYSILVVSLSVGQIISGICGTFLVHIIERAYTFHQEGI
jgi:uncharacterized membrane protein